MSSEDEIISALTQTGLTRTEAVDIAQSLTSEEIEILLDKGDVTSPKQPGPIDGFTNALILAGLSIPIAKAISQVLGDDEETIRLLMAGQTPLIFMTQQDSKVDDKICLPKQGEVWSKEDPKRPRIPLGLHKNCRCFWQDPITGRNLGQF